MPDLHLGTLAHTLHDPFHHDGALELIPGGALLVDDQGRLADVGTAAALRARHPEADLHDHGTAWLLPGLIDGHIHFPQFYATASYGAHLLDWLNHSIFPQEARFADPAYAAATARAFVAHLLAHGTTTALVFGSQFPHAMRALFSAARDQGLRLISGLTLMDRGAPDVLLTTPGRAYDQAAALIAETDAHPLLHYAVTPRFALSCTRELLAVCGRLKRDFPHVFVQTHINENDLEIQSTGEAFPEADHYLDVYQRADLLHPHTVLAHSIHTSDAELAVMAATGATVCHCPCSNFYLGSGLFPLKRHVAAGVSVMVGTDIGGGANFSMLRELADVYKVAQMRREGIDAARLLYLGTLGGARGLGLDAETGNFTSGKSADFLVVDPAAEPYLAERLAHCANDTDRLFVLLNRADHSHIAATYVAGRKTGAA